MSNTPKIRFSGFTDDWKQRRIIECASFSKGYGYSKSDIRDKGTPLILYGRLYTKHETVIENVDTFAVPTEGSVYSCGGEVIVPASGETAEDIAVASVVKESGVLLGGDLNVITTNDEIDPAFLALSISNGKTHRDLTKLAQGKSVVHIHNSDIQSVGLRFPDKIEQEKISGFLVNLDGLIRIHQREYEKLVALKAACLDKMFPQNGSKVPEIRFAGFSGDWKKRKLGKLASIVTGKLDANAARDNGKYAFFTCGKETLKTDSYSFEGDAILISGNGDLGYTRKYSGKFNAYQRTYVLQDFTVDYEYLEQAICRYLPDRIKIESFGGAMPYIKLDTLASLEIPLPDAQEAKKVAAHFKTINTLIDLYRNKVEKLKQLKQSMLHNMFV